MARQTLTLSQRKAIFNEYIRKTNAGESISQSDLAQWAKATLSLGFLPSQPAISRTLRMGPNLSLSSNMAIQKRYRKARIPKMEEALARWVLDQQYTRVMVSGELIKAAGRRIMNAMNGELSSDNQVSLKFSNGWLCNFQSRWGFRSIKSHGESGDADKTAIELELPRLRRVLRKYSLCDIWNADEFGHQYCMAPDRTIAHQMLEGRKKDKKRITYLACGNADGSERFPLMIIGKAFKPRPFKGKTGQELGFDYWNNAKAWMKSVLFFKWLKRFDAYIGKTKGRKVVLLVDNCSAHGTTETVPALNNVSLTFLPPNTTSKIQPMDAGGIAAVKSRYRKLHMERALDAIDENVKNIYRIDQLTAMHYVRGIWDTILNDVHYKCSANTGLLDEKLPIGSGKETVLDSTEDELSFLIEKLTVEKNRITKDQLLNPAGERDCWEVLSEEELGKEAAEEIMEDEETRNLSIKEEDRDEDFPWPSIS